MAVFQNLITICLIFFFFNKSTVLTSRHVRKIYVLSTWLHDNGEEVLNAIFFVFDMLRNSTVCWMPECFANLNLTNQIRISGWIECISLNFFFFWPNQISHTHATYIETQCIKFILFFLMLPLPSCCILLFMFTQINK